MLSEQFKVDVLRALESADSRFGVALSQLSEKLWPAAERNPRQNAVTGAALSSLVSEGLVITSGGRRPRFALSPKGAEWLRGYSLHGRNDWTPPAGLGAPPPHAAAPLPQAGANDAVVTALLAQNERLGQQVAELSSQVARLAAAPPGPPATAPAPPAPTAATPAPSSKVVQLAEVLETLPRIFGREAAQGLARSLVGQVFGVGLGAPVSPAAPIAAEAVEDPDDGVPIKQFQAGTYSDGRPLHVHFNRETGDLDPVSTLIGDPLLREKAAEGIGAILVNAGQALGRMGETGTVIKAVAGKAIETLAAAQAQPNATGAGSPAPAAAAGSSPAASTGPTPKTNGAPPSGVGTRLSAGWD